MTIHILDGRRSASLPRRALAVMLSVGGGARTGVRLRAVLGTGSSGEPRRDASVHVHSAGLIIVPRVDEIITIVAEPYSAAKYFEEGTVLHLSAKPDAPAHVDVETVQLAPRTVSGRASIDLVTIEPSGVDEILVRSLADDNIQLGPLADRARVACRGALGVDSLPPSSQIDIGCVIDCSASMARYAADGTLSVATDIVTGIAAVIGGENFRVALAAAGPVPLELGHFAELTSLVQEAVQGTAFGVGADVESAVQQVAAGARATFVITDMPGPLPRGTGSSVFWLAVSGAARSYPGFQGAALHEVPAGASAPVHYQANPQLVDHVVQALVAPMRVSGVAR